MQLLYSLYAQQLLVLMLVLTRIGGLLTSAPIWSMPAIPIRIRALLAIALALLVAPMTWDAPLVPPTNLIELLVLLTGEFVLGLTLGLAVTIYFAGVQLAGQVVGQMSGMSLADVVSPGSASPVPVFSQFLHLLMLAIFVVSGGLEQVLDALLDMFRRVPPGQARFAQPLFDTLSDLTAMSFQLGLRVAAPAMVALLLSILIMGLISRTLPQLNVLAVGFSMNAMITLSALLLSVGFLMSFYQPDQFPPLQRLQGQISQMRQPPMAQQRGIRQGGVQQGGGAAAVGPSTQN